MNQDPMIFQEFIRQIQRNQLIFQGDKVLLALSAGADSTAMLALFLDIQSRYDLDLVVAHLNHEFRGKESKADEEFVRALAAHYRLPCVVKNMSPADLPQSGNQEDWAREQRYQFLQNTADSLSAQRIALGHTQNDQAETVLLRLLRGSGSLGLAAMPVYRNPRVIRPLLSVKREAIRCYLRSRHWQWREDSSNQDMRFSRNRVRHSLIPLIEQVFNSNIVEVLAGTAESLRGDVETLEWLVLELAQQHVWKQKGCLSWELCWMKTLPRGLQRQLVRYAYRCLDFRGRQILKRHVDLVLDLLQDYKSGKSVQIGRIVVRREFDRLLFEKISPVPTQKSYCYRLGIPGQLRLQEAGSFFEVYLHKGSSNLKLVNRWEVYLSPEARAKGLQVRNWQSGDAYQPVGSSKTKKIKELFLRKKIGVSLRLGWPIVTCGDRIICVRGFPVAADNDLHKSSMNDLKVVIEERTIEGLNEQTFLR